MEHKEIVVALDKKGHNIVVINNIIFYGKKNIHWNKVKQYLMRYIGEIIEVVDTGELINIDNDFPDEFKGSEYTKKIRGANAKAKANVVQAIREVVHIAKKVKEMENQKSKNAKKAKYGCYRYSTRFAIPVMSEKSIVSYYNVYLATLIVRKADDKELYLYDVINIKKEASTPFEL
jgi:hypothetical protein